MASAEQLATRNAIILAHLGLPEEVAWHYRHWVFAAKVDWEDAVQVGMVALVEAAEPGKWQPQLGPFNAFAWRRIIWALRHLCHPPKAQRKSFEETPQADVGYELDKPEEPEAEFDVDGLNLALDELPDNEAELLRRRFWDGETLASIGNLLGIGREAVRRRQQIVLDKLRERLELYAGPARAASRAPASTGPAAWPAHSLSKSGPGLRVFERSAGASRPSSTKTASSSSAARALPHRMEARLADGPGPGARAVGALPAPKRRAGYTCTSGADSLTDAETWPMQA